MGGGRDFLGNKLYRRVGGKYERTQPYKKEYDALINRLQNEKMDGNEIRETMHKFGFEDRQLKYLDQNSKYSQEISLGLAKMAMAYGTDMLGNIYEDDEAHQDDIAHAHLYSSTKEIHLNKEYFSGTYFDSPHDSTFHPANDDVEQTVEHEYAHLLERRLGGVSRRQELQYIENLPRIKELQKEYDDIWNSFGKLSSEYDKEMEKAATLKTKKARDLHYKKADDLWMEMWNQPGGSARINRRLEVFDEIDKLERVARVGNPPSVIENIFNSIGIKNLPDVGRHLTGSNSSYATYNWHEAHAECVADVMRNGKNASLIAKDYVREMNKYFKNAK